MNDNDDLKIIKKKYGEDMMHLCRSLFPTLLDKFPGKLSEILLSHFAESRFLYDDLTNQSLDLLTDFKEYIYSFVNMEKTDVYLENKDKSPYELLKEAGYTLYECKSEAEIQEFKKYYHPKEELCTFHGGRLKHCYVYFAVKDNVSDIKRENFKNPQRDDEYGTSVISIQFSRDKFHTLSIKNRYNHRVNNPDATFSNNLDNIIPGLTESFADYEGMNQYYTEKTLVMPKYINTSDGKYYKYNYEIDDVFFCPNNIIIKNYKAEQLPKEQFLIADYYIIDFSNKTIKSINKNNNSFLKSLGLIKDIKREKDGEDTIVTFTNKNDEKSYIKVDKLGRITEYKNNYVKKINEYFLEYNEVLNKIELENVEQISESFLEENLLLKELSLPNVKKIGDFFLYRNIALSKLNLPKVIAIDDCFLASNKKLKKIELPNVVQIGSSFLRENEILTQLSLPIVEVIGKNDPYIMPFLQRNRGLKQISLPNLREIYGGFILENRMISKIILPKLEKIYNKNCLANCGFLSANSRLKAVDLPCLKETGDYFISGNSDINMINIPSVEKIGNDFLSNNMCLSEILIPKATSIGIFFLVCNENNVKIVLPNDLNLINKFLYNNPDHKKNIEIEKRGGKSK